MKKNYYKLEKLLEDIEKGRTKEEIIFKKFTFVLENENNLGRYINYDYEYFIIFQNIGNNKKQIISTNIDVDAMLKIRKSIIFKRYADKNREKINKNAREYAIKNQEKLKQWRREYEIKNRDIIKEKRKKYYEENKERFRKQRVEYVRNYRRKKSLETYEERQLAKQKRKEERLRYYEENKERIIEEKKAKRKEYIEKNKEKFKYFIEKWEEENKESRKKYKIEFYNNKKKKRMNMQESFENILTI